MKKASSVLVEPCSLKDRMEGGKTRFFDLFNELHRNGLYFL